MDTDTCDEPPIQPTQPVTNAHYFFIVGVGRSGTSLLQSMLAAHPAICIPPETGFVRKYVLKPGEADSTLECELLNDKTFGRLGITTCIPELLRSAGNRVELFESILATYARGKSFNTFGDKDPRNIDYIEKINDTIPGAKFVHIIRDPRGVVLSRTKAAWSRNNPFFLHPTIYKSQISRGRKAGRKLGGLQYLEVRYENLIKSPEAQLTIICEFLNVNYDPVMISSYADAATTLVSSDEMDWKKETLGPLLAENSNKWKSELTQVEIFLVESICASAMETLGYDCVVDSGSLHPWDRIMGRAAAAAAAILSSLYGLRTFLVR